MIHAREDYNGIQDPDGKIADDEPVFLIRASDIVSSSTVRAWAELNSVTGGDPELSRMALKHAQKMDEWQADNRRQLAGLEVI